MGSREDREKMPEDRETQIAGADEQGSEVNRKPRAGSGLRLERGHIVRTALELVDRDGLDALSMRRLGAELGVDPMAIYYHIPNKQALLEAIVEAVMSEIDLSVDNPAASPEERVLCAACAYRDVMLAHVNALPILLAHGPATPAAMRPVECLIGILRDAGLPPPEAFAGMQIIAAAVRGAVGMGLAPNDAVQRTAEHRFQSMLRLFQPTEFPYLLEALPYANNFFESGFDFGIRILVRGLLTQVRPKSS
jgi:AcrR family transcriptional regulator